jgi:predicted nucleotidyltransferase
MRLKRDEIEAIKSAARGHFGADVEVRLFGSRIDDSKRGGDIDLYVESSLPDAPAAVRAETDFWAELQRRLGERRIDVLVDYPTKHRRPAVYQVAKREGIRL